MPGVLQSAQLEFNCVLPNGLHARPASHLSEEVSRFASQFTLTNLRSGASADLKSVLAIVAADVRAGDACRVSIAGPDADAAAESLRRFVTETLPACDEPLARPTTATRQALPEELEKAGAAPLFGTPVSSGIGQGRIVTLGGLASLDSDVAGAGEAVERARLNQAFAKVRGRLQGLIATRAGATAEILQAHLAILADVGLERELERGIASGKSAASAVAAAGSHFAGILSQSESALVRERALDVQELCVELVEELEGKSPHGAAVTLRGPSVVVADMLAPHQLLALDRTFVEGLILESAGATSHAVILARSLGIPAVSGIPDALRALAGAEQAIVDGSRGVVYPAPSQAVVDFYARERATEKSREALLAEFAAAPAVTLDGTRLEIAANISSPEEVEPALRRGADNIGLIRTEILFAASKQLPSEDEQFELYAQAARAAGGRSVVIRTLDAGADKPIPALPLPPETNPFLGYRGIRIYPEYREWFGAQLRAAYRASAFGPIWIMAPMIANLDEARWFAEQCAAAKTALTERGLAFNAALPIGAMIEIPSAAFLISELAGVFDFFSIGANDLSQYFFAAGRENPRVGHLAAVRNPAFLRILDKIATDARAKGKWVGMCGEMAGDTRNLPLLLGLGLDEISVSSNFIAALKQRAAQLSASRCRALLARAAACATSAEVDALLDAAQGADRPLLDRNAVIVNSSSRDKRAAINEVIGRLFAAGRVNDPRALEEAVWAREAVYSTGLGYGFAVPHCKSDAVSANSIAILKLAEPIEWGSLDGAPVRMVILLALRGASANNSSNLHMKVFSRLARKLMDEDFRQRLLNIADPAEFVSRLGSELDGEL